MNDPSFMAPLAAYHGHKPPVPSWFADAVANEPERTFIEVEGARIETLAWGERGKPGLLFLHGGAAHADWWAFIAPFIAAGRRVVAPTLSGMGRSDWREAYDFKQFVREAREAGRALGAFDGGPPAVVGHSFGGRVAAGLACDFGDDIGGAVLVDPPVFAPQGARIPPPPRAARTRRVDPSLAVLVARFRLMPPQPCANPFVLDFIARRSATETMDAEGRPGWALSFDPGFWEKSKRLDPVPILKAARSPLAVIRGEKSRLFQEADAAYLLSLIPPGAPYVEIPEAEHHVMIDQPLAFVGAVRALLATWPEK
ncbi:MAG TPA: alpha/beta hydrolase [Roseiarcus sp.]|nr:alpha/beta hydrolase [Roseiarcus sp.]